MATLISQNAAVKDRVKKIKRKALDESLQLDVVQEMENSKDLDVVKPKKKKKELIENKQAEIEQEMEMKKLENALFGSLHPVEFGKDNDGNEDSALFFTDRSANSVLSVYEEDGIIVGTDEQIQRKPVWVDEEEEKTNINIAKVNRLRKIRQEEDETLISGSEYVSRLRAQHVKMNPSTEWARQDRNYNSDEDSDQENGDVDSILQTTQDLVVKSSAKLLPGLLEYSRLVDANAQDPSSGPINSVQFHRNGQLLLTGGLDKKLRFFQIDGKRNTKIQTIFVDDCPIRKASFTPDGSQVILSGRRKFFYSFDLVKAKMDKIGPLVGRDEKSLETFEISPDSNTIAFLGNEGYILLVSSKTKELIGTLKMNGTARALAFTNGGQQLMSTGGDGQIYHWDLRTMTCFHKGVDDGCITGTALGSSPNGNIFAAGSDSGIVNIYNRDEFLGGNKKPIKTIENLTTKVDFMRFNSDAQILAICSSMKKNSMKLVHIPSFTVFSNWPPSNRTLQYPRCLDFSPGGGMMAMGNAAGHVLLYKLNHYQHA
ncbi:U3 small nucleolar RNA-associated protein 18 homolog [Cynara cardunculus var. scolymus]|uniref:U3 small nucleolar RNA-associated protein 18 homolog n=1 Tax=Cynara cardunculus var. scolymus TaxID=59895 RepID=A0A124SEC1_CYNCS|nr:U3 small nucleolar RNA-associated protein 18 homolog [Cynara cardunculus var. scolymus]XP_024977169.1 U3 small nucleolar RNA-associated protein 18 homolog [Cynara cardunculus var. scolymus]KVH99577.1 WD40 repeat-containing protein [Cynara cardunculus var. scolymus]